MIVEDFICTPMRFVLTMVFIVLPATIAFIFAVHYGMWLIGSLDSYFWAQFLYQVVGLGAVLVPLMALLIWRAVDKVKNHDR